jgi:hypothetical protein
LSVTDKRKDGIEKTGLNSAESMANAVLVIYANVVRFGVRWLDTAFEFHRENEFATPSHSKAQSSLRTPKGSALQRVGIHIAADITPTS